MRTVSWPLAAVVLLSSGIAFAQTMVAAKPGTVVETASPVPTARVQAHVMKPAYMTATKIDTDESADGQPLVMAKARPQLKQVKLNVAKFGEEVRTALSTTVRGYALQLRKDGVTIFTHEYNKARAPKDGDVRMTVNTRMHIASMSKLIASMATVKALEDKKLPWETKIGSYLPAYWTVGSNVADITFKDLMTQRGFAVPESSSDGCGCRGDYETMRSVVAGGVAATRERRYENVNFSILRVLDSILTGAVSRGSVYQIQIAGQPNSADAIWDIRTTDAFLAYVNAKVFAPAGVSAVGTAPNGASGALAYQNVTDEEGWDSGELATQLGGVGFRMSVKEYLDVMDAWRRKGTIVPVATAQAALDAGLGLDNVRSTPAGKAYDKNGRWGKGGHSEQTVGFFLPEGMELVVFTNSNLPNEGSFRGTILNAYLNNLE